MAALREEWRLADVDPRAAHAEGLVSRLDGGSSQDAVPARVEHREAPFLIGVKRR
jgi:hypothetical protein